VKAWLTWTGLQWPSCDNVGIQWSASGVRAEGNIVGVIDDEQLSLRYAFDCNADWTTRRLAIELYERGETLVVTRDDSGTWSDGGARPDLDGCVDMDISVSPVTNTLPVRRIGLQPGERADIRVVYIEFVPELALRGADQRYTLVERTDRWARYRFESGDFSAYIEVDHDGFVIDYQDLWVRPYSRREA
jgi:hypothetical protein